MTFDHRRLEQARLAAALSRQELADTSNVSVETIRLIELGHVTPQMGTLRQLCHALGIDPATCWTDDIPA